VNSAWRMLLTSAHISATLTVSTACKHSGEKSVSNPAMTDEMIVGASEKDAISTTVQCQFRCSQKTPQTKAKIGAYEPALRGLKPGNGNMWGSLTSDLQFYAQELCLEEAVASCGSLAKIDELAAQKISSGTWFMKLPVPCLAERPLLSPFEPGSGAVLILAVAKMDRFGVSTLPPTFQDPGNCQHWIEAETCFGDCLMELGEGKWKQTLMSNKPLGTGNRQVCGDELLRAFAKEKISSKPVKNFLCHHYFWQATASARQNQIELACAAYRVEPKCAKFVESL